MDEKAEKTPLPEWYYEETGQRKGPVPESEIIRLIIAGELTGESRLWKKGLPEWINLGSTDFQQHLSERAEPPPLHGIPPGVFIHRMATYELGSGIAWLCLGILQVISLYLIIAGIWNIIAAISRLRIRRGIESRASTVPAQYECLTGLIVIGVINLIFGGVIGVLLVGFDFYIRQQILQNRHLFVGKTHAGSAG